MNGRGKGGKRRDTSRDGTAFVALPTVVLDSKAYQSLGYSAKALLVELARQLGRSNNGSLLATEKVLGTRGWNSPNVITNALRDLVAAGLLHQTVKGQRPHRASWYAATWYALADLNGYDAGAAATFQRGAYLHWKPAAKNASLTSVSEVVGVPTASVSEIGGPATTSVSEAIKGTFDPATTSVSEDHLDIAICMNSKSTSVLPANNQRTPKTTGCGKGALRKTWGWAGTPRTGNRAQYRWPITALLEVHAREFAQIIH